MGLFSSRSKTSASQTTTTQNAASNTAPVIGAPSSMGKGSQFKPVVLTDVLAPVITLAGSVGKGATVTNRITSTDFGAVDAGINVAGYAIDASLQAANSTVDAVVDIAGRALGFVTGAVEQSNSAQQNAIQSSYDFAAESRDSAARLTLDIVDGYAADTRAALNDAINLTRSESDAARDFAIEASTSETARLSETGLKIAGGLAVALLFVAAWVMKK